MKRTLFFLLLIPLVYGCSSSDQSATSSRSSGPAVSTLFQMNYELREDWIIEYYQFHNVSFRNPNAPFGYALYIFPDNLYYVVILRNSQDFKSRPYDKRLLTRSYITPIEMRRTEIYFERAEFDKLPAVLPVDEDDQEECRKDAPTVRIGYDDDSNGKPYITRVTSYSGCNSDALPEEFYRLQNYLANLFAQLRVRQNVSPEADFEDAIAQIEAAIDTTFMQPQNRFPDPDDLIEEHFPDEMETTQDEQPDQEEQNDTESEKETESESPKEESSEGEEEEVENSEEIDP